MNLHKEIAFEKDLAEYLQAHGWLYSPNDAGYDRERALFPEDVLGWLADTQPEQLAKVVQAGGDTAKQESQLLDRIVKVLDTPMENGGGTLNVLRKPIGHLSAKFAMCVFKPESTLNEKRSADYAAVRLRVMRQVHFSTAGNQTVDLVFFVNGSAGGHRGVEDRADSDIRGCDHPVQETSRLPKRLRHGKVQPLFVSGAARLCTSAVSEEQVWMTTKLAGDKTHSCRSTRADENGGAATCSTPRPAYLVPVGSVCCNGCVAEHPRPADVHQARQDNRPDQRQDHQDLDPAVPVFPPVEAVTELTAAVTAEGVGKRYLIQHSAGSGKTDSIAWTAHRMARLQVNNEKVFESVIVVTDRNVLDAQLQDAITRSTTTPHRRRY